MLVIDGHRAVQTGMGPAAIALGNFDGVHAGHRELLRRTIAARPAAGKSVAYTFEPHPAEILAPKFAPKRITSLARRLELLAGAGIDVCVVEPFDAEFASFEPRAFFEEIIAGALSAAHVVVGFDFTFGRKRSGTTETLAALCDEHAIGVEIVAAVTVDDIVASSTKIRNFLGDGNLGGARLLLGRNYDVDGVVVTGARRGRELGFPTANLETDTEVLSPTGIYATRAHILDGPRAGETPLAATSLGTNPTFEAGRERALEAHLLDWDGDLYGCRVRVEFVEYLRPEQRFASTQDLVRAIHRDVDDARRVLERAQGEK